MTQLFSTNSFTETQQIGKDFSKKLKGGDVLALHGDLGSGKTTFTQGLAAGLGINNNVISPTFIVIKKYEIIQNSRVSNLKFFYHIDLYRIEKESDIKGLGLEEILSDKSNIVAIEWPEKINSILPKGTINLYFEYNAENKRQIKIT